MASKVDAQKFDPIGTIQKLPNFNPTTVASAIAMDAPTAFITRVSGTAEMTTIGLPWDSFAGEICFIPTAAFTGATSGTASATAGKIGLAFTAVAARALFLVYEPTTQAWYPHY